MIARWRRAGARRPPRAPAARPAPGRSTPARTARRWRRGARLLDALGAVVALAAATPVPDEAAALGRRAAALRDELRIVLRADDPAFVFFVEIARRRHFLRALPIEVSGIVRELLLDRARPPC